MLTASSCFTFEIYPVFFFCTENIVKRLYLPCVYSKRFKKSDGNCLIMDLFCTSRILWKLKKKFCHWFGRCNFPFIKSAINFVSFSFEKQNRVLVSHELCQVQGYRLGRSKILPCQAEYTGKEIAVNLGYHNTLKC
jgi:hypothetical protein